MVGQSGISAVSLWLLGALIVGLIAFMIAFRWWNVPGWLKRRLHIQTQMMGIVLVVVGAVLLCVIVTAICSLLQLEVRVMEILLGLALGFDFALIPSMLRPNDTGSSDKGRTTAKQNVQRRKPPQQQGRRSKG